MSEIWILGATGRTGRAAAVQMASAGFNTVLVGRDEARLRDIAARIGNRTRTIVAGTVEEIVRELGRNTPPAVVLNTIGPFAKTAVPVAHRFLETLRERHPDLSADQSLVAPSFREHPTDRQESRENRDTAMRSTVPATGALPLYA